MDILALVAVALLGYLAGRRFPHLGGRIIGRLRAAAVRPPGPWPWWSRLLCVAGALAATAPVWPIGRRGDPIADSPGDAAAIVLLVLVFPVAWALLGRSRPYSWRVAVALVACVAGWSLWTAAFGSYATPPNVDDGLRWYLVVAGVIVASATVVQARWRSLRVAGVLVWVAGVAAVFAVPVVGDERVPPRDAVLPLPAAMTVVHEEAGCAEFHGRGCWRRLTVAATDGAPLRDLSRGLGEHLSRSRGWRVTWYGFDTDPCVACRPVGGLTNPYRLCAGLRSDPRRSTVEIRLGYANPHDPIYD